MQRCSLRTRLRFPQPVFGTLPPRWPVRTSAARATAPFSFITPSAAMPSGRSTRRRARRRPYEPLGQDAGQKGPNPRTLMEPNRESVSMDEITALAKRRGFIFQSSEIYGGIGGFYDYGPLGSVLKRNVKDAWWRDTVELRDDVVAFDSSIVMHPLTWKASGHVDQFHDRMVDCKVCKHRFRFDHLKSTEQCPDCGSKNSFTEPRDFNLMLKTYVGPMEDTASAAYLRPETAQGIFVNFKNIYQTARKKPPFG